MRMAPNALRETRRRLAQESGTIFKDWGGRLPIAIVYPNSYYIGMSNLGFQTIYGLLNSYEDIVCERSFYEPATKAEEWLPLAVESQRPLQDFPVLAFSISYELDYFHVVQILRAAGVPLFAQDRDDSHAVVLGGGPCVTANPEPLAPFFDALVIGEGEPVIPKLVEALTKLAGAPRTEQLAALAEIPGVYVPLLHRPDESPGKPAAQVQRQWAQNIDAFETASVIITPDTELGDMYIMEASRGCGRGCRFCLAGYLYRPQRPRSLDGLLAQARDGLARSHRIGLMGAAVGDHPQLEELVVRLRDMEAMVSVSSLRIEGLSPKIVQALVESGARNITLAPETGSERLRRSVNKAMSNEDVLRAVDLVAQHGLRQLKLYFIVGLPSETEADIEELIALALACKERIDRCHTGTHLVLDVSPFIPKAGTAFQWHPMAPVAVVQGRLLKIRHALAPKGVETKGDSASWSQVQAVLARGDRRLAPVLTRLRDSRLAEWRKAWFEAGIDPDYYAHRPLSWEESLPWAFVDSGITDSFLRSELRRAQRGLATKSCPPGDCHVCGVC